MDWQFIIQQLRQFLFDMANHGAAVFLGTLGITVLGLGPIGRALASRIRGGAADDATLGALQQELSELNRRQDYAEGILVELRRRALPSSSQAEEPSPVP